MAVTVTEIAAREVWQIIKQQNLDPKTTCLRVGVKGGGCSGFSYLLDLTESKRDTDEVWEFTYEFQPAGAGAAEAGGEGSGAVATASGGGGAEPFTLRVVCDPKSYLYLNGTVVDFKDELMGRGFVFNNPNATSTCGCGSSFGV
jgi:iron-sulfur cluster assembly protein